jgi:GNAT superfamily N-acetyltransferase
VETVRPARPEDRAACEALLERALAQASAARGGSALVGAASAADLLDRWLGPGSAVAVFVGDFEGAPVGLLAVTTFTRPGADEPTGRVECSYVEDGARGVGVGSALMEAAVTWCTAQGCADIDARALPGDRATKQRLEAAGFTARLLTLNRRLR